MDIVSLLSLIVASVLSVSSLTFGIYQWRKKSTKETKVDIDREINNAYEKGKCDGVQERDLKTAFNLIDSNRENINKLWKAISASEKVLDTLQQKIQANHKEIKDWMDNLTLERRKHEPLETVKALAISMTLGFLAGDDTITKEDVATARIELNKMIAGLQSYD